MSLFAIFGGTFNPVHIGHYEMLKSLCAESYIDKVLVLPDNIPPHKDYVMTVSDSDRAEMCRIICEDFKKAELSLCEFERGGKSYTYDTVLFLKNKYKDTDFAVVCGGDMVRTLDTWYNFNELKKLVSFIVFNRDSDKEFFKNVERLRNMGAEITVINTKIPPVSSAELRSNLVSDKIPKKVFDYIKDKGLYNGK